MKRHASVTPPNSSQSTVCGADRRPNPAPKHIKRLLAERPRATGLADPGMPVGSPGMEVEGAETFEGVLFGPEGQRTFARYRGAAEA